MGDCRIRFMISKSALRAAGYVHVEDHAERRFFIVSKSWSSDTTIREVIEGKLNIDVDSNSAIELTILSLLDQKACSLWDCTVYPAVEISDLPLVEFKEKQRPTASMTLYAAGWFPSGTLQVLAKGQAYQHSSRISEDDTQYNIISETHGTRQELRVHLTHKIATDATDGGSAFPLPSQILHAVTQRFDGESGQEAEDARLLRQQNKRAAIEKEQERFRKLDERIQRVKEAGKKSKNQNVSDQVRRMLIKSRATGQQDLRQEDRVYLHCFVSSNEGGVDENEKHVLEDYRFFSLQSSVGRVLESFKCIESSGCESELLVISKQSTDSGGILYRRLPALFRLYEAISKGFLDDFDEVVVRFFDPKRHENTASITEIDTFKSNLDADQNAVVDQDVKPEMKDKNEPENTVEDSCAGPVVSLNNLSSLDDVVIQRITHAISMMEDNDPKRKKSKKPISASILKVQQLQMKSKAKGDSKRVKMEDRIFFELIIMVDDSGNYIATSSNPCFLAYSDPLSRIVRDCAIQPKYGQWLWEIYIPKSDDADPSRSSYLKVTDASISCSDAEKQNLIKCFQRIVVRFNSS